VAPRVTERPDGVLYREGFVTEDEELQLVDVFDDFEFSEVRMHGQAARRTVLHFGYRYDYEGWKVVPVEPLPASLEWLLSRAAALVGVEPEAFAEALVTRYPPGAGIGWHRDAPLFGPQVVGVSLLSPCSLRFQRGAGEVRRVFSLELAPRSVYVLSGPARSSWQHSIPTTKSLRYSVTFRTLTRRSVKPRSAREGPPGRAR
jgi:alkylated DNA repair dioxygenase AlkB